MTVPEAAAEPARPPEGPKRNRAVPAGDRGSARRFATGDYWYSDLIRP